MNVFCIWGCLGLINGFFMGEMIVIVVWFMFLLFLRIYLVYVLIFNLVFFKVLYIIELDLIN